MFVLRQVFDLPYAEISDTLERSPSAVRHVAHRARSHVQARRPHTPVSARTHADVTSQFVAAVQDGSIDDLLPVLAPEVTLNSDGGGRVSAAIRPILGSERVSRFLLGLTARYADSAVATQVVRVNGQVAIAIDKLVRLVTSPSR